MLFALLLTFLAIKKLLKMNKNAFFFLFFLSNLLMAQVNSQFSVVLDAGHGGDDPGAVRYGNLEKDIALKVVLKVGDILKKYSDIETKYTRKTDVFIELSERAKIANKYKANLFVSIHCNSVKSSTPMGTETFVMGISKNASNLAVAKKENSVILLESDYKIKYGGYDPNVPETLIGLQLMQEEKREQSINLASKIQEVFTDKLKRVNRGVKEAPLWVLNATYMPSVLIEIGFISNKTDADFIASESGQNQLASVIAEAIVRYKKEFFGSGFSSDNNISIPAKEQSIADSAENLQNQNTIGKTSAASMGKVYKIQLSASTNKISTQSSNFNGLSPVTFLQENKLFKYMYGEFQTLDEAQNAQKEAKAKGYPEAFIVSFENGVKVK